jgi:hypothetical protein
MLCCVRVVFRAWQTVRAAFTVGAHTVRAARNLLYLGAAYGRHSPHFARQKNLVDEFHVLRVLRVAHCTHTHCRYTPHTSWVNLVWATCNSRLRMSVFSQLVGQRTTSSNAGNASSSGVTSCPARCPNIAHVDVNTSQHFSLGEVPVFSSARCLLCAQ